MSEQKPDQKEFIDRIAAMIGIMGVFMGGLIINGASRRDTWNWQKLQIWFMYEAGVGFVSTSRYILPYGLDCLSWFIPSGLGKWIYFHVAPSGQFFVLGIIPFFLWLSLRGAGPMIKLYRFQRAIDYLGLKTPTGEKPKVVDVVDLAPGLRKIIVHSVGFDPTEIRNKKVILESSLNLFVQDVRVSETNLGVVEIRVSDKELPTLIPYDEVSSHLAEPYSFLVGQGMYGFIKGNLQKVHHMMVAGASGGGKSFFVKQLLIGLLQSSSRIQLYLLDLKMGVEVKVFERLENVYIAKDSLRAIEALDAVVKEMDRRFQYLEENGYTEIDSERDKLDRVVVLVDEASELFTIVRSSKAIRASAESARDLADRIAKLGRVAGIHLIVATQKVEKASIDTRIQANINARMIFRVPTTAGSVNAINTKLAIELPEIGGRGIWSVGSKDQIVQTPKLDNEEVAKKVTELLEKFNGKASPLSQKMLLTRQKMQRKIAPVTQSKVPPSSVNAAEGTF